MTSKLSLTNAGFFTFSLFFKTLAASLPTTGDDAGLSLSLTFIGMILFGAVGVILALFQKHGRHSK